MLFRSQHPGAGIHEAEPEADQIAVSSSAEQNPVNCIHTLLFLQFSRTGAKSEQHIVLELRIVQEKV